MAPDVGPTNVPGLRKRKPRPAQPAKFPASVVTIASSGSTRRRVVMTRPGWTPGPVHSSAPASTTVAASKAARSAALCSWRTATRSASRTALPTSRSLAARRNVRASDVTVRSGGVRPACRFGSMSTWIQRVVAAGMASSHEVGSLSRLPMTSSASALGQPLPDGRRGAESGHAEVQRFVVGDDVPAAPRGDDRDLQELREAEQVGRRPRAEDPGPGEDDRPAGRGQQLDDRAHVVVGGPGRAGATAIDPGAGRRLLVEEVLRQRHEDRTRDGHPGPRGRPRA